MKTNPRKVSLLIAALVLAVGTAGIPHLVSQTTTTKGKNQCYRGPEDPENACTLCGNSCQGGLARCCNISPDPYPPKDAA